MRARRGIPALFELPCRFEGVALATTDHIYIGHGCMRPNFTGHNHMGPNNIGHNCICLRSSDCSPGPSHNCLAMASIVLAYTAVAFFEVVWMLHAVSAWLCTPAGLRFEAVLGARFPNAAIERDHTTAAWCRCSDGAAIVQQRCSNRAVTEKFTLQIHPSSWSQGAWSVMAMQQPFVTALEISVPFTALEISVPFTALEISVPILDPSI